VGSGNELHCAFFENIVINMTHPSVTSKCYKSIIAIKGCAYGKLLNYACSLVVVWRVRACELTKATNHVYAVMVFTDPIHRIVVGLMQQG
jgi:hypothetical protein